jgi:hypothetical protein
MFSAADFEVCANCSRTRDDCTCKEEALLLKHGLGGVGAAALLAAAMCEGGAHEAAASVADLAVAEAQAKAAADAAASEARRVAELPPVDFAPQFVPAIRNGRKRATTRSLAHEPALAALGAGKEARAVCAAHGSEAFALLKVTRMESGPLHAVNAELAAIEGFAPTPEGAELLRQVVKGFYPGLRDEDAVSAIHFEAVPLDPP